VREGKLDLAIEEYLRLVEDQPGDVGAANTLGDLYAKVGHRASAVAQFVRIGDIHRESGFVPKAIAFYKKALKVDPASDHALSQLAQIAVEQELFADATLYLNRLLQRRREQKNEAGVAECLVRLGRFPTATADARTAAARAAAGHFAASEVLRLWIDAADALERASRPGEAVDALIQAVSLDPDDVTLRRRVAVACADTGQIERAQAFLSFETAGDRGDLLMALARSALVEGRHDDARRALQRVVLVAPDQRTEAESLLTPLLPREPHAVVEPAQDTEVESAGERESEPDAVVNLDADEPASAEEEPPIVAGAPTEFEWPAQFGSEDVEEAVGAGAETEVVFVADEPAAAAPEWSEPDPEVVFQQVGEPDAAPVPVEADAAPVDAPVAKPETAEPVAAAPVAATEEPEPPVEAPAFQASPADASTIAALTAAAENPALLFQASAQLGRLLLRLDRGREGVAWLERATQATTAMRDQRLTVMYELADALERIGERTRALDVFADLDFDAASYRDVPERMARLRRALEEGRAP